MLGIFGSVISAYNGTTTSAKVVPTVLKISGSFDDNTTFCNPNCQLSVYVNNNSIYTTNGNDSDLANLLANGFFVGPFSSYQTSTNKTMTLKVDIHDIGGGGAVTANDINTIVDLPNPNYNIGYLMADNVVDGAITTGKLADSAITTSKLADSAITTSKLADSAITTGKLADDSVNACKLNSHGSVPIAGQILSYTDSEGGYMQWINNNSDIADGSVTTDKLADGAVNGTKVSPGSLDETIVSMRSYLKLTPQTSAPVTCDSSHNGYMYILRVDGSPPTFHNKICAYTSGTTTTTEYDCKMTSSNNVCEQGGCEPGGHVCPTPGTDGCYAYQCTTTAGNGYQWMDVN